MKINILKAEAAEGIGHESMGGGGGHTPGKLGGRHP